MVVTVFMLFWTVFEQKTKMRLMSEIFEFSYLALGKFENTEISEKLFPASQMIGTLYLTVTLNGSNCFHAFLDCFRGKE